VTTVAVAAANIHTYLAIISIPSPPHFFIPSLKPSFRANSSTVAFLFFFRTDLMRISHNNNNNNNNSDRKLVHRFVHAVRRTCMCSSKSRRRSGMRRTSTLPSSRSRPRRGGDGEPGSTGGHPGATVRLGWLE